jgi:hypothetical protein
MARTKNKKKAVALPAKKSLPAVEDFQSGLRSQPPVSYRKPKTRRGLHGASKRFEKLQKYIGSGMRENRLEWIDAKHGEFH